MLELPFLFVSILQLYIIWIFQYEIKAAYENKLDGRLYHEVFFVYCSIKLKTSEQL